MEKERTLSIFQDRRPSGVRPTEAGVSIANIFGNRRLNKAERQGLAFPVKPRKNGPFLIDPAGLAGELRDLAQDAGLESREIGEEI